MDVILIPGLWLDGSSWQRVVPELEEAGHRPHPLTLPGMESMDARRSQVSRRDHVDAAVAAIDSIEAKRVILVAHSAAGGIAHAAVDARPERVAHVVYVGGFPTGAHEGREVEFRVEEGEVPLPEWSEFDEADLADLDEEALEELRARSIPSPARVLSDPQHLSDDRRYDVPVTMVCTEYTSEMLREWVEADMEPVREIPKIREVTFVDLPTGHWPQFTRPRDLASLIAGVAGETPAS